MFFLQLSIPKHSVNAVELEECWERGCAYLSDEPPFLTNFFGKFKKKYKIFQFLIFTARLLSGVSIQRNARNACKKYVTNAADVVDAMAILSKHYLQLPPLLGHLFCNF